MSWLKKDNEIDFSKVCLIGVFIMILVMTIAYTIIFCIKGDYPKEIYLAIIPTAIAELVILCKLKLDKRKADTEKSDKA